MYARDDPEWRSPGADDSSLDAELASLLPVWQRARDRIGRSSFGISGLTPASAVAFIERFYSSEPMPNPKGMATVARARFAIDDIKLFYFEAAMAEGGHPSAQQLQDWFWDHTLAGACIREFQERARNGDDSNLVAISESLVPAERTISYQRG